MRQRFGTAIVGGGPAGLAPLLAASRDGTLDALLEAGVAVVERQSVIGPGRLGDYLIRSDSAASTFLACLEGAQHAVLRAVRDTPAAQAVAAFGEGPLPLTMVARFLGEVGAALHTLVASSRRGLVLTRHEATRAVRVAGARWAVTARCVAGRGEVGLDAERLVLASGAVQDRRRLERERLFGKVALLPRWADRTVMSDDLLRPDGLARASERLAAAAAPSAVVLGGSTSAMAAARVLLEILPPRGTVAVLHRGALRLFYPSAEAARADGYDEFGPSDICPVSGFVNRLGGLRFDARDLLIQYRRADAALRGRLSLIDGDGLRATDIEDLLERATVVVAALGYRPRGLDLVGQDGEAVDIVRDERAPMVDSQCRVLDANGRWVPGVFGVGLAAGLRTTGALGGEPSFRGQTNSLWLWQHAFGSSLARALAEPLNDTPPLLPEHSVASFRPTASGGRSR